MASGQEGGTTPEGAAPPHRTKEPARRALPGQARLRASPPSRRAPSRRPAAGHRFVVQRHRARRLHYDFRLEVDGVLVSWAVPEGPDARSGREADGRARRGPPARVLRLRGRDPDGRVRRRRRDRVGLGHVVARPRATTPWRRSRTGDLHVDLGGEKLRGRFVLVRRGTQGDKEQWLLLHKHDEHAVAGWDPEDHPRSVKSGRTNDEVKAAPAGDVEQRVALGRPDRRRARRPRRARQGGRVDARRAHACSSRTSTRCCSPPSRAGEGQGADQARPDPPPRGDGPGDAPVPRRPAGQPAPLPRRHRQAGLLAQGGADARARLDHPLALRGPRPGRDRAVLRRSTRPPRSPGWRTTAPSSCTRGPRRRRTRTSRPGR